MANDQPNTGAPNTGAPAAPGAPVAPVQKPGEPVVSTTKAPGAQPSTKTQPTQSTLGPIGGVVAPNPGNVQQTTIDSSTTTIHPDASILNPIEPTGEASPPEIKRDTRGPGATRDVGGAQKTTDQDALHQPGNAAAAPSKVTGSGR